MTGTITLYIAASLDGYVADADGGVSWLEGFEDHYDAGIEGGSYEGFFERVDCLVMGAHTYEQILSFEAWPYDEKPVYVVTGRDLPRERQDVVIYAAPVTELASDLRATYDHIWLVGGGQLAQSFMREELLDDRRISVVPVVLGGGIPLFDGLDGFPLHLTDETAYASGIVELCYEIQRG